MSPRRLLHRVHLRQQAFLLLTVPSITTDVAVRRQYDITGRLFGIRVLVAAVVMPEVTVT
jgi:hypothetical protein